VLNEGRARVHLRTLTESVPLGRSRSPIDDDGGSSPAVNPVAVTNSVRVCRFAAGNWLPDGEGDIEEHLSIRSGVHDMKRQQLQANACLLAACLVIASAAFGQGIPSAADAPREGEEIKGETGVVEIREVERGLYFGVDYGVNYYLDIPMFLADPHPLVRFVRVNEGWLSPGQRIGLRLGYDVLNNLNIEAFLLANFNRGIPKTEDVVAGRLTGDVAHFVPGLATRFAFITTERLFVYGRLGLGLAFWNPAGMAQGSLTGLFVQDLSMGFHSDLGFGLEYYTKLRHLSVGFEFAVQGLYMPFAFGFMAYPTLKYTF
jgi:hypothetical protein